MVKKNYYQKKQSAKSLYCQNRECKTRGKEVKELFEVGLPTNIKVKVEVIRVCRSCKDNQNYETI